MMSLLNCAICLICRINFFRVSFVMCRISKKSHSNYVGVTVWSPFALLLGKVFVTKILEDFFWRKVQSGQGSRSS